MDENGVLAIDFGTTNSYYTKCPLDQITPVGIDFGTGKDGLATAVLYRGQKEPLVGDTALEEFGELAGNIPDNWYLRAQFKPDILDDPESGKNAEDFLRLVLEQSQRRHIVMEPTKRQVIFGAPSEMSAEYNQRLVEIAEKAGYGKIRVIDEPKGAILNHLWRRDFSPRDAHKGIMVVDFGGGTCDFAYLRQLNLRCSWGDLKLGGRLFDDLFFQWFLEQNPSALEKIETNGDTYYLIFYVCRKIKEMFSRTMARDRTEKVTRKVSHYGTLTDMTWDEFLERACAYKPSQSYLKFQKQLHTHHPELPAISETVDLLKWFEASLIDGLVRQDIDPGDVSRIILAGGSSQWPFITDIITSKLQCDNKIIVRSDRPYTVISEGLAILPALQAKLNQSKADLSYSLPSFCEQVETEVLEPEVESFKDAIADKLTSDLFDSKLKPILEEFRHEGGRIAELEKSLKAQARDFQPQIEQIIQDKLKDFGNELSRHIIAELNRWLSEHDIALGEENVFVNSGSHTLGQSDASFTEIYRGLQRGFSAFSGLITGYVVGSLAGGGGVALIATGPVAAIVTGLVAGLGGFLAGDTITDWLKKKPVPAALSKRLLTEKRITKLRTMYYRNVRKQLSDPAQTLRAAARRQIVDTANKQIEAISEIDRI